MNIENVVNIYNGILNFSHKKEGNLAMCDSMNGTWGHMPHEISQRKTNIVWCHLYV